MTVNLLLASIPGSLQFLSSSGVIAAIRSTAGILPIGEYDCPLGYVLVQHACFGMYMVAVWMFEVMSWCSMAFLSHVWVQHAMFEECVRSACLI